MQRFSHHPFVIVSSLELSSGNVTGAFFYACMMQLQQGSGSKILLFLSH